MSDITQHNGFIAYRLPDEKHHHLCHIGDIHERQSNSDLSKYQYIFAPFNKNDHATYLFKFSTEEVDEQLPKVELSSGVLSDISKQQYLTSCRSLIDKISNEDISKVILSRTKSVRDDNVDLNKLFHSMCHTYPDAFVYVLHHPTIGTWAAATPELLLSKNKENISTVALAGTRKYVAYNTQPWGTKEIEEHKYIERYVNESLDKLSLQYTKTDTNTRRAGNVEHIESTYDIIDDNNSLEELIDVLHPGPAISGYPPIKAIEIIDAYEGHDRLYYCGYLGPLDIRLQTQLYVNLRCMQIYNNGYKIYVGGGITKDSVAEDEWTETKLKSETLSDMILSAEYENHQ